MSNEAIKRAAVEAAERSVIDSIPKALMQHLDEAQKAFEQAGGCKGCGHRILAVHYGFCPTLRRPDFY